MQRYKEEAEEKEKKKKSRKGEERAEIEEAVSRPRRRSRATEIMWFMVRLQRKHGRKGIRFRQETFGSASEITPLKGCATYPIFQQINTNASLLSIDAVRGERVLSPMERLGCSNYIE